MLKEGRLIRINAYSVLIMLFVYSYGLYGFRRIEPIWQNIDGMLFFWISQTCLVMSLIIVLIVQFKISDTEVRSKFLKLKISIFELKLFLLYLILQYVLNYRSINLDLFGDETSYANYSIYQLQKLFDYLPRQMQENVPEKNLYQPIIIIILVTASFLMKQIVNLKWKNRIVLAFILTFILRILNEKIFHYDNIYTEPLLIFYNFGTAIFGFNNASFRITGLVINSMFAVLIHLILIRLINFNYFKAMLTSVLIISLPLSLSSSTKIDHARFTYYLFTIFIIVIFSKKKIPHKYISFFLVLGFYFSFSSASLLAFLFIYCVVNKDRRKVLRIHLFKEWKIYIFLLPQLFMHVSRIIMGNHLNKTITGYIPLPYDVRVSTILSSVTTSTNLYNFFIVLFGIIYFPKDLKINRLGLFLFICILSFVSVFFIYIGALGENRYALQYFYPLYPILIIRILNSSKSLRRPLQVGLFFVLVANIYFFESFQNSISKFDDFINKANWRIASDYFLIPSKQPENIYYASTSYSNVFQNYNTFLSENNCILTGYYSAGMPELFSGYSHTSIRNKSHFTSRFRESINNINLFIPGQNIDTGSMECIVVSIHLFKKELVNYLLEKGWLIEKTYDSSNGIKVLILRKPNF